MTSLGNEMYERFSRERKISQTKGDTPPWYTTGGYIMFKQKYLFEAKSIKEQFQRIAATAAKHSKLPKAKEVFFNMLWDGILSPSTPVLSNMGTRRGFPISCAGSYVGDSVDSFYQSRHEVAMLTKMGFGTSAYLGDVRKRGSPFKGNGKASGVAPLLQGFVQDMSLVSQGSNRRGAFAGYLPVTHGDFDEVCDMLMATPDDLNIGWIISDAFIDKLNKKDEDALRRYKKILKAKMITGKGYFWFSDKANRKLPQHYKDEGLTNKASNLCVAPETLILTDVGYLHIADVSGQNVNVWNGTEWSNVVIENTSPMEKVVRVVLSNGQEIEATEYHKWYVQTDYKNQKKKATWQLVEGDKLIKFDLPVIEGSKRFSRAYENGFFTADGCEYLGKQIVYLYGEKKNLIDNFTYNSRSKETERISLFCDGLMPKFTVPLSEYTVEDRLAWFAGLCDGDGTIARNGTNESLQVGSVNKEFLLEVSLMLQTLGVHSKVTKMAEEGARPMPDGKGGSKDYFCQTSYRLIVTSHSLQRLLELGLKFNRLKAEKRHVQREASQFVTVVEVIDEGRYTPVYCFKEEKEGKGVFNGVLTGQCSEILLPSDDNYTYSCVLSSLNLVHWDKIKENLGTENCYVMWATEFLNCVIDEFLEQSEGYPGFEKIRRFTAEFRAIGLGVCGYHTLLLNKRIPWESLQANWLNCEIFDALQKNSFVEGRYNASRLAIAPTKSTALLMGGVSEGINPMPAYTFTQNTAAGNVDRIEPVLLDLVKERCDNIEAEIAKISAAFGSVQDVDWLTDEEKQVFKTAFEINQHAVVRHASMRSDFIDQWQSVNLFFSADASEKYVSDVFKEAMLNPKIIGLYYAYTLAGVKGSTGECESCM